MWPQNSMVIDLQEIPDSWLVKITHGDKFFGFILAKPLELGGFIFMLNQAMKEIETHKGVEN